MKQYSAPEAELVSLKIDESLMGNVTGTESGYEDLD